VDGASSGWLHKSSFGVIHAPQFHDTTSTLP